jgi:TRAP-type C4-dicarboxylate transport system substrate-binding protein
MTGVNQAGVVLVAGLALALVAGCRGSSSDKAGGQRAHAPRILKMADPVRDPLELEGFVKAVARLSGGTIRIQLRTWRQGQAAYENGLIRDVRAGKADLGVAGSRAWDSVGVQEFRALHAPFLIDNYPLEETVVQSALVKQMLRDLQPLGLVGLGVLPGQMRRPFGTQHPLVEPADFADLTIAVQQSRVADETMRALGAKAVWVPTNRINVKRFGAIETRVSTIDGFLYDAKGDYLSANVDLWPRPLVVFANRGAFDSLSSAQQHALRQAAARVIPDQIALDRQSDREASADICRRGLLTFATASREDLAALRRAVQPVYDDLERDAGTRTAIATIERLKRDEPAPSDTLPACPTGHQQATGSPTPIDGVYEMTTNKDAAGLGSFAENWGKWIFVFDRGRFADTQENKEACTWGYGTFTVDRHEMAWSFTNGGGIAPNGAENKPGEFFRFGWSRYRGTLTVTPVKGATSPSNFRAKPWRLVSTTSSRRYFSKRCPPPAPALAR